MKRENIKKMHMNQENLSTQLLNDYRHYCTLAFRLEELHQLVDKRHEELKVLRDSLERKFIEKSRHYYREEKRLHQPIKARAGHGCGTNCGVESESFDDF